MQSVSIADSVSSYFPYLLYTVGGNESETLETYDNFERGRNFH